MQPDVLAARFALGRAVACEPIAEGLMNPNWRLTTSAGVFAVKQLRDADPAAVLRQHAVLPQLAARACRSPRSGPPRMDTP